MSPVSAIDPGQSVNDPVVAPPADEKTRSVRVLTPPDVDPEMVVEETPPFPVRPITVEQYEYLVEVGFFGDARVEMLDGFVVNKMVHGTLSAKIISILNRLCIRNLTDAVAVRPQLPIRLQRSEPEPDLALAVGPDEKYAKNPPTSPEIFLVIEVSDSTLSKDRGTKLRTYARNLVREYWIMNCVDRQLEIYTDPVVFEGQPKYSSKIILNRSEIATLRIEGQAPIEIPLTTLFGE